ncbi:MAG: riboflavin synthase [Verrucomicrobia bacterium]|nr:MAG: riboflavin synthase [Verrucomicrobiota bacterium]
MFTGLVQEVGNFIGLETQKDFFLLSIQAPKTAGGSKVGDSVAVDGCCLTVVSIAEDRMHFNLLQETLKRTSLGGLHAGDPVNCEPALAAGDRFGGHLVQGHIDTTAQVISTNPCENDFRLEIEIPPGFGQYLISQGSVAVNGVSLTVAELKECSFVIWIIPHTLENTNLGSLQAGKRVNLEFDVLAKYVERLRTIGY